MKKENSVRRSNTETIFLHQLLARSFTPGFVSEIIRQSFYFYRIDICGCSSIEFMFWMCVSDCANLIPPFYI